MRPHSGRTFTICLSVVDKENEEKITLTSEKITV
jgi:hypothetical protein